ncbi:MAG: ArnT family glycosyltransferase [Spirulinaceae cyanobacterium]
MTVPLAPKADRPPTSSPSLPPWVFHLALPVGFWAIALLLMPIARVFQFDVDEGQEMVKASLYNQGYALFTEIWSDHPPLLTFLLAPWLRLWGDSVVAARLLMLGFATLLVWSFAQLLRRSVGDRYALVGTVMLVLTANFLRLSVSVMIGLPALAMLLFSLYALVRHHESRRWVWLVVAALAAGCSLQFKMFTVLLLPLWGLYLGHSSRSAHFQTSFQASFRVCCWLGIIGGTFLALGQLLGAIALQDFFLFHVDQDVKSAFVREHSLRDVALFYLQDLDYGLLMFLGLLYSWRPAGRKRLPLVGGNPATPPPSSTPKSQRDLNGLPLLWLVWVTLFLVQHKPIWYHHYMLLSLPLTWLATLGLRTCVERVRQEGWRHLSPAVGAIAFLLIASPIKLAVLHLNNQDLLRQSQEHQAVIAQVRADADANPWLFTDIPMYGVYTQRQIPLEIATLSRKRIAAQDFTAELMAELIEDYDLQQFVIGRFPIVEGFLNDALPGQLQKTEHPVARYYRRTR